MATDKGDVKFSLDNPVSGSDATVNNSTLSPETMTTTSASATPELNDATRPQDKMDDTLVDNFKIFSQCDDSIVMLYVPPGKPNPRLTDFPSRVMQKPTLGPLCFFASLKMADRLENYKYTPNAFTRKMITHEYSKPLKQLAIKYALMISIIADILKRKNVKVNDKAGVIRILKVEIEAYAKKSPNTIIMTQDKISLNFSDLNHLFQKYIACPTEDMLQFIHEDRLREEINICKNLIPQLPGAGGSNPEEAVMDYIEWQNSSYKIVDKLEGSERQKFVRNLPLDDQRIVYEGTVHKRIAQNMMYLPTKWNPKKDIRVLFDFVNNTKGPILMGGYYGDAYYKTDAEIRVGETEHYEIYGWKAGSHIGRDCGKDPHMVAVIGVECLKERQDIGGGYVYFLDSSDPSHPGSKEKRKLHKISYKQFCALALPSNCVSQEAIKKMLTTPEMLKKAPETVINEAIQSINDHIQEFSYGWLKPESLKRRYTKRL